MKIDLSKEDLKTIMYSLRMHVNDRNLQDRIMTSIENYIDDEIEKNTCDMLIDEMASLHARINNIEINYVRKSGYDINIPS